MVIKKSKVGYTFKFEKEDYEKFVAAAEKDRRSLNNWVTTICLKHLENNKK